MKKSEVVPGGVVVIRGNMTHPNTIRCGRVISVNSYTLSVEYLYGFRIDDSLIDWPAGPRKPNPAQGEHGEVRLSYVLRNATIKDKRTEQEQWDVISDAISTASSLRDSGVNAKIAPEWPLRIRIDLSNEDAKAYQKAASRFESGDS